MRARICFVFLSVLFGKVAMACAPTSDSSRNSSIGSTQSACSQLCASSGGSCLNSYVRGSTQNINQSSNLGNPAIDVGIDCVHIQNDPGGPGTFESIPFVGGLALCSSQMSHPISGAMASVEVTGSCATSTQMKNGSFIDVSFQTLGEEIPLVGVPFTLFYSTDLIRHRNGFYKAVIPVTQSDYSPSATLYNLKVWNEGNQLLVDQNFSPGPSNNYTVYWNGNKANGTESFDPVPFFYRVSETGGVGVNFPTTYSMPMGTFRSNMLGLGHFLPSMYSYYDSDTSRVYFAGYSGFSVGSRA